MKKTVYIVLFGILFLYGCERRDIVELNNTHYVRVYINEELKNVTCGFYDQNNKKPDYDSPDVLRLFLADPQTGELKAERFLRNRGTDSKGTYYEGYIIAEPGNYTLLAYNYDTESTVIANSNNHIDAKATTNEIAAHLRTKIPSRTYFNSGPDGKAFESEKIVYDPDHLFCANCGEVVVPHSFFVDTLRTPEGNHFYAESIVKSYYLQVRVKGLKYTTSSVGLLTGMSGSSWCNGSGMDEQDNVTLYFELLKDNSEPGVSKSQESDVATIYTTLSTFGRLPKSTNELKITFDFLTIYGEPYSETLDISNLFFTPEGMEKQWLLVDHTIVIPDPPKYGGDGFKPIVDEWEDIESDIII